MNETIKMLPRYRVPVVEKKSKTGGAMKKRTHEEYVKELKTKNPTTEVIGKYINARTKIEHHCLVHDIYWDISPDCALYGHGCPECHNKRISAKKAKTTDEYAKELAIKNPNIEVIEPYINAKTKIKHHCLTHDIYWNISPISALRGSGCKLCKKEKLYEFHAKTNEQYVEELKIKNPTIIPVEKYVDSKTKIKHLCLLHNIEWNVLPSSALDGHGCVECQKEKCRNSNVMTHDEYVSKLTEKTFNIEIIGKYINSWTPILHRCLIDGFEWLARPANILHGCGCPKCAGNIKLTQEEYVNRVNIVNPDIEVIGRYNGMHEYILHKCKIDGHEWYTTPNSILQGNGCPQCHESSGERQVRQWLEKYNISYIFQQPFEDCRDIKPLPFDFYLPDYNYCIEYDYKQHFEPIEFFGGQEKFELQVKHDNIKTEYCKTNGIPLLRIPYYKNVEEELNNFLFI